jgi:hypothetical protein
LKNWLKSLLIFASSWALSGCSGLAFRHYDPIPNCLPSTKYKTFQCSGAPGGAYAFPFEDTRTNGLVCFPKPDFLKHEQECHSK